MAEKPVYEELEQKVKQLEKEVQDCKGVEAALKDYVAYQSVLAVLRGVRPGQTEEVLLHTFLSEIVKQYGFCMSWYGRYAPGEIRPILSAGRVDRYLDNLVLEIRKPASPDAQCAMSQAILTGTPFTYADLERDEGFRRWRDYALELGYRSNLALPLKVNGHVEGGVMVYADTPNAFPEERIERLQLLTSEISAILSARRIRQKAEDALRKSEQKYRTLVETSHDIIFTVDLKGNFLFTNKAFESILGYSDRDAKKLNGFDLVHPEDLDSATKRFAGLIEGSSENNIEYRYRSKDGSYINILTNASPIFDSQGNVIAALGIARDISELKRAEEALRRARDELEIRVEQRTAELARSNALLKQDITERKRAEKALKESEDKYRSLFTLCPQAIAITEPSTGRLIDVNSKFCELTKYTREEVIGRTTTQCGFYSKEHRDKFIEELQKGLGELHGLEMDFRAKDGSILTALMFSKLVPIAGTSCILTIFLDLTHHKRLETQLQHAQRMEAIGTLAGGIAHDFNNLLMGVQGNVSLILFDMDTAHPFYEMLKSIEHQVRSGAALTRQLLGYARKGKYEVRPIDLNELIEQTSQTFGRTRKDTTIHLELAQEPHAIEADHGQIEQVLLNLYVNATDAMPGGGNLFLKTAYVTQEDMQGRHYDPKPGRYVLLTVTDTGKGMDKETQERIFEPFFTTKEMGRGTGLGLASVYGIVKGHGGYIDVDSEIGQGTTFSVYLPATEKKVEKTADVAEQIIEGSGTVLLADDEEAVLEIYTKVLHKLGYTVMKAKSGREAVGIYRANTDKIDLVLLDMVMPDMGGGEAYDRMKEIDPNVKVLLISGYSMEGEAKEILARGCNGFIQKPFSMNDLARKMRELLDRK